MPASATCGRVLAALAGMASGGCASTVAYTSGMTTSVRTSGPFSLRLEAPAVVAGGQPVPLRLVLTNISKDTVMFALPSLGQLQTDYKVYRWSYRVRHKLWHR